MCLDPTMCQSQNINDIIGFCHFCFCEDSSAVYIITNLFNFFLSIETYDQH